MTTTLPSSRLALCAARPAEQQLAGTRVRLSQEQQEAATCPARLLRVIAGPGSGKSSVAAYRFGLHRFDAMDGRAVIGLSFTRAAVGVLRGRIADYWGSAALTWPHTVITVDELHRMTVEHLLRSSALGWSLDPDATLEVVDAWSEEDGCVQVRQGQTYWRAGVTVTKDGSLVVTPVAQSWPSRSGKSMTSPARLTNHLFSGRCTHDDIRGIVSDALDHPHLRVEIASWAKCSFRAFVVDEAYDSNPLDIEVLRLLTEGGSAVTLIGDHWQALYEFRGATPALFNQTADELGFVEKAINGSFRFTAELQAVAQDLRHNRGVILTELPDPVPTDVVLAPEWAMVWSLGRDVLPLAIGGAPKNVIDAAMTVVLDALLVERLHLRAAFRRDARRLLGVTDDADDVQWDHSLSELLLQIAAQQIDFEDAILEAAAQASTGAVRKIRAARRQHDPKTIQRYEQLADRVRSSHMIGSSGPVAGLTIHQAKGQEWERVAVAVREAGYKALTTSLDVTKAPHRTLYVGMTRARSELLVIKVPAAATRRTSSALRAVTTGDTAKTRNGTWFAVGARGLEQQDGTFSPGLWTS